MSPWPLPPSRRCATWLLHAPPSAPTQPFPGGWIMLIKSFTPSSVDAKGQDLHFKRPPRSRDVLNTKKMLTDVETWANYLETFRSENNHLSTHPTEGWCCQHPKYWFLSPMQKSTETRTSRGQKINFYDTYRVSHFRSIIVTSVVQIRKLPLREVKGLAGEHTAHRLQSWDPDLIFATPRLLFFLESFLSQTVPRIFLSSRGCEANSEEWNV